MKTKFEFISKSQGSVKDDILSGLTVSLALVPEAVAFAFVAGVSPIIGLYGAFMMGIVTAIFGGRPGMISGATGAMAVVMVSLIQQGNSMGIEGANLGLQYLFATLILAGILQILAGYFKMGKLVRMIPASVMMGFVNGLAIIIFLSQLEMFTDKGKILQGAPLLIMSFLVLLTMLLMYAMPKINKSLPSALIAILFVSAFVIIFDIDTQTVRSFVLANGGDGIAGELPTFNLPYISFSWQTLAFIFPYAFILAAIGLIESLMTLNLIDELTETRGDGNRECLAQGFGNVVNGFFGGMGGCAMIGQSIINIKSGGRGRLSGVTAATALLCFILFASAYIEQVPIASLVGVMFMVVIGTFSWNTFKILNKVPIHDVLVIFVVTVLTVFFDLAIAVFVGIIISALVFAWKNALHIRVKKKIDKHGVKHYRVSGLLFFASTEMFLHRFNVKKDPQEVVIDFEDSRIMDQSAIEVINKLAGRYMKLGKHIHLRHLSRDCTRLIKKAEKICEVNILEDPDYFVAIDNYRSYVNNNKG